MTLRKKPFENSEGKRENAGNQHFLLSPQCFQPIPPKNSVFLVTFILSSVNAFNLDQSQNVLSGKELTLSQTTNFRLFQTERVCRRQFQIG